jgi:hypothetical protein
MYKFNEIKCHPVYLVAPRGRKLLSLRHYLIEGRHNVRRKDKMKCELCEKNIGKGKTYFNVEIEYNEPYDTWFEGHYICKECFEKYTKEELVNRIENKRRENYADD